MRSNGKYWLSSPRRKTRWSDKVAVCGLGIVVGLFCVTTRAVPASKAGFEIGQRWQYRHEGPRPGSIEPNTIDGERILWVVSVVEEQERAEWVIEERFTKNKDMVGRLYVDRDGLLTTIEIQNAKGERARLRYDPPVPYQPADMNVGEVRTIQTTLRMDSANFALPNKTVIERLTDETVSTSAGEFPGCSHFRSTTTSTVDIKIAKIPVTEEREQWYHPSVNVMVKEVYHKGPIRFLGWSRPGYTATSTLTAYGKEQVDPGDGLLVQTDIERSDQLDVNHSPSRGTWLWSEGLILAGIAAFTIGALALVKRADRRRGCRDRSPSPTTDLTRQDEP
jgi:hypothetical protein